MRVGLIGGTGFVGGYLVDKLMKRGQAQAGRSLRDSNG